MQHRSGFTAWLYRIVLAGLGVVLTLAVDGLTPRVTVAQQVDNSVQPAALNQITALLTEKAARTPTEQKVDSHLLYAFKRATGAQLNAAAATLHTTVPLTAQGAAIVDISANVNDALLGRLQAFGGKILSAYPEYHSVRATVPLAQIGTIAGWPEVRFIQPARQAMTASGRQSTPAQGPFLGTDVGSSGSQSVQPAMLAATQGFTATTPSNRSEGYIAHRVDQLRQQYGYTGANVKVCVLSDGVNALSNLQASGDLPAVTVVPGEAGDGNEGAAMLEIVHDLAPGAQLFYATAFTSLESFAANIKSLRNTYHCDILVDDVAYFVESPFQLGQTPSLVADTNGGLIAQAVNDVVADGALYFAAAGNSGNLNDHTAGVWEGNFVSGGAVAAPLPGTGQLLNFDPGNTNRAYNTVTQSSSGPLTLFWADPLGGSNNDYDLFLLNANGSAVVDASTNVQNGSQDPFEITSVVPLAGQRVVVVRRTGAARYLHVNTNRGELEFGTAGQTGGHSAALDGFAVAAAGVQNPPVIFSTSTVVESFSSDGPRRYFFNPNGTPITPGDFSATGGAVAQKPDLTAADGVSCAAPGFNVFYGTSAAAPHAAAIAALLHGAQPTLTNAQLRTLLTSAPGAIDIETSGVDRDSGAGVLDALAARQALNLPALPLLTLGEFRTGEGSLSNHNGVIESGEIFTLTVALTNTTLATAPDVQVALTLVDPPAGVQVLPDAVISYGALAPNSSLNNRAQPFAIALAPLVPCGVTLNFKITVTYGGDGGNSPQVFFTTLTTGTPLIINTTLDATAPPSSTNPPAYQTTTGTQTGRLGRDSIVATCSASKLAPDLLATTGARRYDAYTFTNAQAQPTCVTATLNTPQNGANDLHSLFMAAYGAGGFSPADPKQNYLGDPGGSPDPQTPVSFSFLAPANQPLTLVVHEITPGDGTGTGLGAYTLTLAGLGFNVCSAPPAQPASITVVAGSGQSTPFSTTFPSPLQAVVKDSAGQPVAGLNVAFSAPISGTSGLFAGNTTTVVTRTNASGIATTPAFTANSLLGNYRITASVLGYSDTGSAAFVLTNTFGSPASITATAGSGQSTPLSTAFTTRLQATVKDAAGHLLPNISVTFTAPISGPTGVFAGGVNTVVTQTNASGVATAPPFTANNRAGGYVILANVAGVSTPATFGLTNTLALPTIIAATGGNGQSALISTLFTTRLQATVQSTSGQLLAGINVTFTAPLNGASGVFPGGVTTVMTQTNASGVATAPPFTANGVAGNYTVLAQAPDVAVPATFALVNLEKNSDHRLYLPLVRKGGQ